MHRFIWRLAPLVVLSLIVSGCGNNNTVAPAATTAVTDSFTGTVTHNGATTYSFTATGVGSITAVLTTLTPDSAQPVGLSLGTWNGSICQIVLADDASIQGTQVLGNSSATGSFCVRIYDAGGTVVQPETYTIDVTHQ